MNCFKHFALFITINMALRRSQANKSNINEKIKTLLEGNQKNGVVIECYGEKGKGIKVIIL